VQALSRAKLTHNVFPERAPSLAREYPRNRESRFVADAAGRVDDVDVTHIFVLPPRTDTHTLKGTCLSNHPTLGGSWSYQGMIGICDASTAISVYGALRQRASC
jgi:hypothetical protein